MKHLFLTFVLAGATLASSMAAAAPAPPTYFVSGTVVGSGAPLPHVKIELRDGKKVLGSTSSDAGGHFQMTASPRPGRQVTLHFEVSRFEPLSWTETAEVHKDDVQFVLDPVVDAQFLESLPANPNPEGRLRNLADALTSPSIWNQLRSYEMVFPLIGRERADLRTLAQSEGDDQRSKDIRDHALALLALWGDPADQAIVQDWERENPSFSKDHPDISEPTVGQVCESWAVAHFKKEGTQPPYTYHGCFQPAMDPDGQHAFLTFAVRYAHWSYGMYLVLQKEGDKWKLIRVIDGWIT
jgi:hypothetical protein